MIEDFLLLIQSNIAPALLLFSVAFWVFNLYNKNQKLEHDKEIGGKASKEDLQKLEETYEEKFEELKNNQHKTDIEITFLKSKIDK